MGNWGGRPTPPRPPPPGYGPVDLSIELLSTVPTNDWLYYCSEYIAFLACHHPNNTTPHIAPFMIYLHIYIPYGAAHCCIRHTRPEGLEETMVHKGSESVSPIQTVMCIVTFLCCRCCAKDMLSRNVPLYLYIIYTRRWGRK